MRKMNEEDCDFTHKMRFIRDEALMKLSRMTQIHDIREFAEKYLGLYYTELVKAGYLGAEESKNTTKREYQKIQCETEPHMISLLADSYIRLYTSLREQNYQREKERGGTKDSEKKIALERDVALNKLAKMSNTTNIRNFAEKYIKLYYSERKALHARSIGFDESFFEANRDSALSDLTRMSDSKELVLCADSYIRLWYTMRLKRHQRDAETLVNSSTEAGTEEWHLIVVAKNDSPMSPGLHFMRFNRSFKTEREMTSFIIEWARDAPKGAIENSEFLVFHGEALTATVAIPDVNVEVV